MTEEILEEEDSADEELESGDGRKPPKTTNEVLEPPVLPVNFNIEDTHKIKIAGHIFSIVDRTLIIQVTGSVQILVDSI